MKVTGKFRVLAAGMLAILGGCTETQWKSDAPGVAPRSVSQALSLGTAQVRDIHTRPVRFPSFSPGSVELGGGVSLFVAQDELHGQELWKSDGTEAGTSLVKDVTPGAADSNPRFLTPAQGKIFFAAQSGGSDDFTQEELWKTDGTAAGTVRVKRFPRIGDSDQIGSVAQAGGTVFFVYHQQLPNEYQQQLWKSDGTEAGTVLLHTLDPEEDVDLLSLNNSVFFITRDATRSLVLWKRAAAGTVTERLKTFPPSPSSYPSHLRAVVGNSLFIAVDKTLWKSDGTAAGTVSVSTLASQISGMAAVNGTLFFASATGLWKSDGTTTALVRSFDGVPGKLTAYGNALYFIGTDAAGGSELWKSDGTAAGTVRVKDLVPGAEGSALRELLSWNGGLYFTASTTVGMRGLWRSDGTSAGTVALKTWAEGDEYSWHEVPHHLTPVGSALFFALPEHPQDFWPRIAWRTNGTAKGTRELVGAWTGTRSSQIRTHPLATIGGTVFFAATDGNPGEELWKSDGTPTGTVLLRTLAQVAPETDTWLHKPGAVRVGDTLFFTADDGVHGLELWKSDGTAVGTVLVKDLSPGPGSSFPEDLTELEGALFFTAQDDTLGDALWRSDGTAEGTVLVKATGPENSYGGIDELTAMDGVLYFAADDSLHDLALWKSDGTPAGTSLVKVPIPGEYSRISHLTAVNGTLFFAAHDGYGLTQLWKSNGTESGTVFIKDGFETVEMAHPVASQNLFYFTAATSTHGYELWRSDGTPAGTFLLKDIQPGAGSGAPHALTSVSSGVVFVAYEDTHGWELWKTNGTAAGTNLLVDLIPGPSGGARPMNQDTIVDIFGVGDRGVALFNGVDAAGGAELWQTDGTVAGTFRLIDLVPGPESSEPNSLARMGDRLFFMAGDKAHGREPRFLPYPRNLGSATGTAVVQGSTCTAQSQVTPSCTFNALAPDASFVWKAPSTGTFTFTTEGSSYDTSLEVSDSVSGTSLGCNDDTGETLQSSVAVSVSAGQTVVITVDGYDTECGPFLLTIRPSP